MSSGGCSPFVTDVLAARPDRLGAPNRSPANDGETPSLIEERIMPTNTCAGTGLFLLAKASDDLAESRGGRSAAT